MEPNPPATGPQDDPLAMVQQTQRDLYGRILKLQQQIEAAQRGEGVPARDPVAGVTPADIDQYLNGGFGQRGLNNQLADLQKTFDDTSATVLAYQQAAKVASGALTEADKQTLEVRRAELDATLKRNQAEIERAARQDAIDEAKQKLEQAKFDQANKADPDGSLAAKVAQATADLTAAQAASQQYETETLNPARKALIDAQTAGQNWDVERGKALLPGEKDIQASTYASQTAQAKASEAEAALRKEELRQKQLGELGAFIDSLATAQKAGLIDRATSERLVAAKEQELLTGGTTFDRQKQAEDSIRLLANDALQSGNAVRPDQQYMVGGNPGGDIQQALGGLGIRYTPEMLKPASMPAYAQSLGITTPQQVAASAPAYAQGLMGPPAGVEDWSGHDLHALHATLTGGTQAAPANSPTPSTATLFPGNVPPDAPPGTVAGGVNSGLLLSRPIVGAPNYARLGP